MAGAASLSQIEALETPALAPVDSDERLHALDILRGLALFAMIVVHFHQKMRLDAAMPEDLIPWGVYVLLEQKAWGTFAFLFGAGFAVLLRRLEARRAPFLALYIRRLVTLAVFGLVAEVAFGFTILTAYACWGAVLFLIRRWPTRALLAAAVAAAAARPLVAELVAWRDWWIGIVPAVSTSAARAAELARAVDAAARGADYPALFAARWAEFVGTLPHRWGDLLPDSNLALFIIGLLAVRHGVLDAPLRHVRVIVRWMAFGAFAWAMSWMVLPHLPQPSIPQSAAPLAEGLGILRDQWLCFTYIGAVVLLLAYRPVWLARLAPFGLTGRMALTNYMLQASVLDVLGSGYGLALRLRPLLYLPAAALLFGVEVALSRLWLGRYRFGPLEWLWRTVTYARLQPLRKKRLVLEPA
ncbi:MAG: DUF418 domain-containing protein [Gemmatimonadales bacterium]